jgi:predicted Zn-dependent protease
MSMISTSAPRARITRRFSAYPALLSILLCAPAGLSPAHASENQNLPQFGDATSAIVSLEQERIIGQDFLRSLRAQAPRVKDPLMQSYVEHLIYKLASHSQLKDRQLDLIIIDDASLNAFAAPGGIVGINLGLFLIGETENEISSILAHELAHLSQRHFARGLQSGRGAGLKNIAGLLAGIVLMTTTGGSAGIAAISAGQGLALNERLRYSRSREAEADRVGIYTLANADMDPRAMAYMFERLERANRFNSTRVPEFLLTHPVTKDRIADSYNQTRSFPQQTFPTSLDFQLMKARTIVRTSAGDTELIPRLEAGAINTDPNIRDANHYGLVLALASQGRVDAAQRQLNPLLAKYPGKIAFTLAQAQLHTQAERYGNAIDVLEKALSINLDNYELSMSYADVLMRNKQANEAVGVLLTLTKKRPNDVDLWYVLAEAYGLSNDVIGVHEARAEYFVMVGNLDQAIKQLGYALPLARDNFGLTARLRQRIEIINGMRSEQRRS